MSRQHTPTSSSGRSASDPLVTPTHATTYRPNHGQRALTGPIDTSHRYGDAFTDQLYPSAGPESQLDFFPYRTSSALGSPRPRHTPATETPHPLNLLAVGPFTPSSVTDRGRNVSAPWQFHPFFLSPRHSGDDYTRSKQSPSDVDGTKASSDTDPSCPSPAGGDDGETEEGRTAVTLGPKESWNSVPLVSSPCAQAKDSKSYFEDLSSYHAITARRASSSALPNSSTPPQRSDASRLSISRLTRTFENVASSVGTRSRQHSSSTEPPSGTDSWSPSACSEPGSIVTATDSQHENAILRAQLSAFQTQNAQLSSRCEALAQEIGALRLTLSRTNAEANSFGNLRSFLPSQSSPQNEQQQRLHLNALGDHSQQTYNGEYTGGSPSLGYLGPSLYESIQAHVHCPEGAPWKSNSDAHAGTAPRTNWETSPLQAVSGMTFPSGILAGAAHPYSPAPSTQSFGAVSQVPQLASVDICDSSFGGDRSLPLDLSSYPHNSLPSRRQQGLGRAVTSSPSGMSYASHTGLEGQRGAGGPLTSRTATCPPDVLMAKALTGRSQEASILLQQQLKSGNSELQASIIAAMLPHILTLCEDKHGNFLVQRAIGVDNKVAWKLKGNFGRLASSQYGCHVVQRILDEDENLRAQVVEELLVCNLPESLTSRNAVHVWAKILEMQWTGRAFRRKVFDVINRGMRGHWASVAMQETGSIVVQNLFESADEDERSECIAELLERLPECALNQWGVWVVQHVIEHGSPQSQTAAFRRLLEEAGRLSLSQFGQKAIMTALKSKNASFVQGYLDCLCEGGTGAATCATGRRSMLVDVASTPQGLQIVTQLLTTVGREDRERIIQAVRKNSVFLKGSKTGLKVHQMCERARAYSGY